MTLTTGFGCYFLAPSGPLRNFFGGEGRQQVFLAQFHKLDELLVVFRVIHSNKVFFDEIDLGIFSLIFTYCISITDLIGPQINLLRN